MLKPAVKDYVWGGTRLKTEYALECDTEIAAEGWMLSTHSDGPCTVLNGEHKGKTLDTVLALWGNGCFGKKAAAFPRFPLLIKLIDAKSALSVQVHPNDEYALENEGEFGKTEMWYVVDCDEGAELIYGFKDTLSKEEFKSAIANDTLLSVCNRVPVKPGDTFFIPAGTLHAIGGGMLIAEVQQNSNVTYRVYDYNRKGTDGKPRPLHIEKALEVTALRASTMPYSSVGNVVKRGNNTVRTLATCELFTAEHIALRGVMPLESDDTFRSLVCLRGDATVTWDEGAVAFKKGASLFVPANLPITLQGDADLLCSYL